MKRPAVCGEDNPVIRWAHGGAQAHPRFQARGGKLHSAFRARRWAVDTEDAHAAVVAVGPESAQALARSQKVAFSAVVALARHTCAIVAGIVANARRRRGRRGR